MQILKMLVGDEVCSAIGSVCEVLLILMEQGCLVLELVNEFNQSTEGLD